MKAPKGFFLFLITFLTLINTSPILAQSDQGIDSRTFGIGQPQTVSELPPGQLKRTLESLPPQARARALRWLQDFSFPAQDVNTLNADDEGNVFYGDTHRPENTRQKKSVTAPEIEAAPATTLDDAFLLHSRPGAPNTVFIDFDGHIISGTAWNGSVSSYDALPYNLDSDPSTFNSTERGRIVDIWHRVAEDLAPFDIDVTTEEPASLNGRTGHILVTHTIDGAGQNMPSNGGGGVAYVGVFGRSNYHSYYSPALVYYNQLGSGNETYVSEASSHEFGHNLGLSHDGAPGTTYYRGQGSGLVSWAPIMGNSYYNNVTQWSKGEYTDANQTQDDLNIIDGHLGYVTDDHGDTRASASTLDVAADGSVISSNPELDPHNILSENKGIIDSSGDVDVFSFVTGSGTLNLLVTPAWDAFYRSSSRRGANLDIEAELQNVSGSQVALSDPANDTAATINATVSAGTYFLLITGVGNAVTPYSDYDSLGQFFINGTMPPAAADENAPTPDPMSFTSPPAPISHDAINMFATTATDDISTVEYNFNCTPSCSASGWQSSTSYTATGLAAATQYTFTVQARDQSNNTTAVSLPESATTNSPPPPPNAPSGLTANGVSETAIDLAWSDNAATETGFRVERSTAGGASFAVIANLGVDANNYSDGGLTASTTYDYRVVAVNAMGDSDPTSASGATMDPPPWVDFVSLNDTPVAGSVSGTHTATHSDNDSAQTITERESGGRKSKRTTYMEHRWNFDVGSGASVTVFAKAWQSGSNLDESFEFKYSLDNGASFLSLFNVDSTDSSNLQSVVLLNEPSGSIIIRVTDTHQSTGYRVKNTLHVDHLYIQVANPPSNPPDGNPGSLTAVAASSSQINLSWTDGSGNESGFSVERSPDDSGNWGEIADLPANSGSYSDTGLAASTRHYYRVRAYNVNGSSAYTAADATTDAPPPPPVPPSGLTATGMSATQIDLAWTHSGSNEDGFRIDRSPSGADSWAEVTTLGVNATSYNDSDNALQPGTTYDYRVVAINGSGEAMSDIASGTTSSAPDLALTASGYKVKGRQHVTLDWGDSTVVDVYRDGSKISSGVTGPNFDDNIGNKGGGSYQHFVCPAGSTDSCSNTTNTVF